MRKFLILPVGIALAFAASAEEHSLSVHASLVHSPCRVELPELIDMGDIPVPPDNTARTSRVQTKTVTGTVSCTAPVRLNIRLSPSFGTHNLTRFHQDNISGSLEVILGNDPVLQNARSDPGHRQYSPADKPRFEKNWPVTLLVELTPDRESHFPPGEVRFATTMTIDYE